MASLHQSGQGQGQGHTLRPVTNIQVHVIADDKAGTLHYKLAPGDPQAGQFVKGDRKIDIPHGTELYKLHFHLVDRDSSRKLAFDPSVPICAVDGSACPTSGGIQTDQFEADGSPSGRRLTITDFNSAAGPVCFSLFFVDEKTGEGVPEFDPIVDNGGGGSPNRFLGGLDF